MLPLQIDRPTIRVPLMTGLAVCAIAGLSLDGSAFEVFERPLPPSVDGVPDPRRTDVESIADESGIAESENGPQGWSFRRSDTPPFIAPNAASCRSVTDDVPATRFSNDIGSTLDRVRDRLRVQRANVETPIVDHSPVRASDDPSSTEFREKRSSVGGKRVAAFTPAGQATGRRHRVRETARLADSTGSTDARGVSVTSKPVPTSDPLLQAAAESGSASPPVKAQRSPSAAARALDTAKSAEPMRYVRRRLDELADSSRAQAVLRERPGIARVHDCQQHDPPDENEAGLRDAASARKTCESAGSSQTQAASMGLAGSGAEYLSPLLEKLKSAHQAAGRAPSSAETGTGSQPVEDAGNGQVSGGASLCSQGGVELLPPLGNDQRNHQHEVIRDCPPGAGLQRSECDLSPLNEVSARPVLSPSDRFMLGWEASTEGQADPMNPPADRLVDLAWPDHRHGTARVAKDSSRSEPVSVPDAPPVAVLWDETKVPGAEPRAIQKSLIAGTLDHRAHTKRRSGSEWLVCGLVLLMIVLRLTPGRTSSAE